MIRKSGNRFSDKIMRKYSARRPPRVRRLIYVNDGR